MKTTFLLIGFISLSSFFTSCKKDDTTALSSGTNQSAMSSSSTASLTELAIASANSRLVTDSTGKPHGPCKVTEIAVNTLPDSITAYIASHYAGSMIEKAGTDQAGHYLVAIKKADGTPMGLLFDASGAFLEAKVLPPHPDPGKPVAANDLPATITAYITSNYSGSSIEKANIRSDGNYLVLVKKTDATLTALAFDANGQFLTELPPPPKGPEHEPRR